MRSSPVEESGPVTREPCFSVSERVDERLASFLRQSSRSVAESYQPESAVDLYAALNTVPGPSSLIDYRDRTVRLCPGQRRRFAYVAISRTKPVGIFREG